MKKITTLLLSTVLAFSLVACGGDKEKISDEALNTLETAIQNTENMKSANYDMDLTMSGAGQTVTFGMNGAFDIDQKLLKMTIDMSAPYQGINEPAPLMEIYTDDEYMYMNLMEMSKVKQKLDTDQKNEKDNDPLKAIKLSKDELKKYLTEASIKGDSLKLVFNCDKMNEQFNKEIANAKNSVTDIASTLTGLGPDTKFNSMQGSFKLENGEFRTMELKMNITAKEGDQGVNLTLNMKLKLSDVNGQIKIELPKDVDKYVESDDASALLNE